MDDAKLKQDMEEARAQLRTLRDEVKLKMHLAGMEAKTAFKELEHKAEQLSLEISASSHRAITEVAAGLKRLSESLRAEVRGTK